MSAPSTLPRWADVSGVVTPPLSGKQDVGFTQGEEPPGQFLNWLFNLIYLWIQYLAPLPNAVQWKHLAAIPENASSGPFQATGGALDGTAAAFAVTGGGALRKVIAPKVGDTIYGIATTCAIAFATVTIALKYIPPGTVSITPGAIQTVETFTILGGGTGLVERALTSAHTVIDGAAYWLDLTYAPNAGTPVGYVSAFGFHAGT